MAASRFKSIDLGSSPRAEHFKFFRGFHQPTYSVTADIEVTNAFKKYHRNRKFTAFVAYSLQEACNRVPVFRQRLRSEGKVIEWNEVSVSLTVLRADETFNFCLVPHEKSWPQFQASFRSRVDRAKTRKSLFDPEETNDGVIYASCSPWTSFLGLTHPIPNDPPDSIPRLAWGGVKKIGRKVFVPVNVQVHHALIDALHIGKFYREVENIAKLSPKMKI